MPTIEHEKVAELIRQAAHEIILPRWRNLRDEDISAKAADDVVTIADREAEVFLTRHLQALLDGSKVVGEEATHADDSRLRAFASDAPVWVIDPLDGTGNFAVGDDKFAVMVALILQGETLAAWIYDPIRETLVSAEKAAGAFLNGARLQLDQAAAVSSLKDLRGALLTRFLPDALRPTAQAAASQFAAITMTRCGGYDYSQFATSQQQFLFYYRTLVWDHAPGVLIAEEAGGIARRLDGDMYHPTDTRQGLLVANSVDNWLAIQHAVTPTIVVDEAFVAARRFDC